jgi:hypothetical protein
VTARDAPIVGVFVRPVLGEPWTCVLRWNWKKDTLEQGAWTTLHFTLKRCCLSPDGEFLFYHARGRRRGGLFDPTLGGAFAVSRLPWVAALTHPRTFGWADVDESSPRFRGSRDALSAAEQDTLWRLFVDWPGHVHDDEHWPAPLGPGWIAIAREDLAALGVERPARAKLGATAPVPGTKLSLLALVDPRDSYWTPRLPGSRYFLIGASRKGSKDAPEVSALDGVLWAQPAPGSRLLVATTQGRLQVRRVSKSGAAEVEREHDVSGLKVKPEAAPDRAKAGL